MIALFFTVLGAVLFVARQEAAELHARGLAFFSRRGS